MEQWGENTCLLRSFSWVCHYNDVTLTSWRLQSPAPRLSVEQLVQDNINGNGKGPHHWPFARWINTCPVNSPRKGTVKRETFVCHDVIRLSWNKLNENHFLHQSFRFYHETKLIFTWCWHWLLKDYCYFWMVPYYFFLSVRPLSWWKI